MSSAEEAVEQTVNQARKLITKGKGRKLLGTLKAADKELGRRLAKAAKERGGAFGDRFTDAKMMAYRAHINHVTEYVALRVGGMAEEKAMQALKAGSAHTVNLINRFEQEFTGLAQPLRLTHSSVFEGVKNKLGRSLLARNRASVARYGEMMIRDFEGAMKRGLVQGMTQGEVINKMVQEAPPDLAEHLHQTEPRHFPDPQVGYMKRRYWAERVVRTETANSYNAANMESINQARQEFPDMGKKIIATFDNRTALDSMYVHGQIRKADEMFHDGSGREYMRPPARPNDRETVIPWRVQWKEGRTTKPRSLKEIADTEAAERSAKKLPKRPRSLMKSEVNKRMERTKQKQFDRTQQD